MEHALVTAVTHSTDEARVTLHRRAATSRASAARIFDALAEANVNVDMIIQNEPVGDGREGAELSFTVAARRPARSRARRSSRSSPSSASAASTASRRWARSRSSAPACTRTRASPRRSSTCSASEGINIEMISTSPIKISCVIRADRVADAVQALHGAFELGRRRDPARAADRGAGAMSADGARRLPRRRRRRDRRRSASMMLRLLRERGFPAREIVPFASERSAGSDDRGRRRRAAADRRDDPGLRPRDLLRRRRDLAASGRRASPRRARSSSTTRSQLADGRRRAARRRRGQPGRARRRAQGDRRQPELLDDADGRRAEAAARRRRHRAARGLAPTRRCPARARRASTSCSEQTHAVLHGAEPRRSRSTPHQIAFNVLPHAGTFARRRRPHRRGAQADRRDAQDPRRRVDPHQRDVRARAGRQRPLGGGQRRDALAAVAGARRASCWPPRPA